MPYRNGRLTPKEKTFADALARTGDPVYSAAKAGYGAPQVRGYELAHKPDLQAEAQRRRMMRLDGLVDLATDVVEMILMRGKPDKPDNTITYSHMLTAAELIIKRHGTQAQALAGKEPSEMSAGEIESTIQALRLLQSEGAKVIDIEPEEQVSEPVTSSLFD